MKVSEIIDMLSEYPPDAPVRFLYEAWCCASEYAAVIKTGKPYDEGYVVIDLEATDPSGN